MHASYTEAVNGEETELSMNLVAVSKEYLCYTNLTARDSKA